MPRKIHTKLLSEYDQPAVTVALSAFNQVLASNDKRGRATPKSVPSTGRIYHYTTADGLKGIIEKNELWASSAYFLNDSAEITYGYGVLKEVLDDWLTKDRPKESITVRLAQDLRKALGEGLRPIYLACFCEDDNLLSQWRAYGQSGGYSLGLKVPPGVFTPKGFEPEPKTYTAEWVRVVYDRSEQAKKCTAILEPLFAILDNPDTERAIAAITDNPLCGYSEFLRVIADILLDEIVSFKNEAFKVEKEWRVVVRERELNKQGTDDGGATPLAIHFHVSRGILVPHVRLIPLDSAKKLPIARIRSGPTLDKTTAGMAISLMLDKNDFSGVEVLGSDISVRM
jgi:hypothetical protein